MLAIGVGQRDHPRDCAPAWAGRPGADQAQEEPERGSGEEVGEVPEQELPGGRRRGPPPGPRGRMAYRLQGAPPVGWSLSNRSNGGAPTPATQPPRGSLSAPPHRAGADLSRRAGPRHYQSRFVGSDDCLRPVAQPKLSLVVIPRPSAASPRCRSGPPRQRARAAGRTPAPRAAGSRRSRVSAPAASRSSAARSRC